MEFEVVNSDILQEYIKSWKMSDWNSVVYGEDVLKSELVAFGVRDKGIPEALVIAELTKDCAEIKMLNYNSHSSLKLLMKRFSDYCHSLDRNKLKYELRIPMDDKGVIENIMLDNGWNEPLIRQRIYFMRKADVVLSKKTKGNQPNGKIVPFFEISQKKILDLVDVLSDDSVFYSIEKPIDEFSLAYEENDSINGFIVSEIIDNDIYVQMDRMTAQALAIVALMTELSERMSIANIGTAYIVVRSDYGDKLLKNIFANQIINTEIIICGE